MALPTLSQKEWRALSNRLTEFAAAMLTRFTGKASAQHAPDVAQDAIMQLYDDERYTPWDPERDPDVFDFLAKAVIGIVKNRRQHASTRNRQISDRRWKKMEAGGRNPEQEIIDRDLALATLDAVEKEQAGDEHVLKVSGSFRKLVETAADQETDTGLHIDQVRNARRRFFDAVDRVRGSLEGIPGDEGEEP